MRTNLFLSVLILAFVLSCSSKHGAILVSENMPEEKSTQALVDESLIQANMKQRVLDFNRCFEDETAKDKSFPVKRVMTLFTLLNDGTVKDSSVVSIHPLSDEFSGCIKGVIGSMKYAPTLSQKPVLVFYPVEYRLIKQN